jgi:hypothetical protein
MSNVSSETWLQWLRDAIGKVKYQKQRTSADRIAAAIRMHNPEVSESEVLKHLEEYVQKGKLLRVSIHGAISYRDRSSMGIVVGRGDDLTKVTLPSFYPYSSLLIRYFVLRMCACS